MATFPTGIVSLTNPGATDRMNVVPHAELHTSVNEEVIAIETALGANMANVPTIPVSVAQGGTGQTTATDAINALLPAQGSSSGKFLTTNGSACSWATVTSSAYSDGSLVEVTAATERNVTSTSYTLLKQLTPLARSGTASVSFSMKGGSPSTDAYGKVYINGIAVGTEHTVHGTADTVFTDTGVTLALGDVVQVYGKALNGTGIVYIKNLKILCANPTTVAEASGY